MLYLARFATDLASLLIDAESDEDAIVIATNHAEEAPAEVRGLPSGMLVCELRIADPIGNEEDDNPANATESGVALEVLEDAAAWLADVEDQEIPPPPGEDLATAETERPPLEAPEG